VAYWISSNIAIAILKFFSIAPHLVIALPTLLFLALKGDSDLCTFTLRYRLYIKNVKERQLLLSQ
jgi:hypothetical protein